ncbi:hypothetical protein Esti_005354 [Eimeria stiedai]
MRTSSVGPGRSAEARGAFLSSPWGASSLWGQALAAARKDGGSASGGRVGGPSRRVVAKRAHPSRSRSRERGGGTTAAMAQRTVREAGRGSPARAPAAAAHRQVRAWLGQSRKADGVPWSRDCGARGGPPFLGGRGDSERLWAHDRWEGGEGQAGSSVFVRGLPLDVSHQEVDTNGGIATAEVSFAERGAAALAARAYHGVSVHPKRGGTTSTLKVAVIDRSQQPDAVVQVEEEDLPGEEPHHTPRGGPALNQREKPRGPPQTCSAPPMHTRRGPTLGLVSKMCRKTFC